MLTKQDGTEMVGLAKISQTGMMAEHFGKKLQ